MGNRRLGVAGTELEEEKVNNLKFEMLTFGETRIIKSSF